MTLEWRISDQPVEYLEALEWMEARATAISAGQAAECIWLLEHPPLYTAGSSADPADLVDPDRFPVYQTRRGGQYTYHGPGQRVVYVMLDLSRRQKDLRVFVKKLENWVIATLAQFNVKGEIRDGRIGVWVDRPDKPLSASGEICEDKIAAIGVKMTKWVSYHGLSINLEPDLSHYDAIVPCGISQHGVTSLVDLGHPVSMDDLDLALRATFEPIFGAPTERDTANQI